MPDLDALTRLGEQLLLLLGEDPQRPGLQATPRRWAQAWAEMVPGPGTSVEALDVSFDADHHDLVAVTGVQVWSLCEHHLLPFTCSLAIGYVADGRVLGLSKLARLAHLHARRLQLQERLVGGIADSLAQLLGHDNVAVLGRGVHLCMVMRGVRTEGSMVTSAMRGSFRTDEAQRAEFLRLADGMEPRLA